MRAGALDYLALPLEMSNFARRLHGILADAGPYVERRRREVEALHRIVRLSRRERQGLGLKIGPRTVEIHRANMMTKLGAAHPADAVKAWIAAGLDRVPRKEWAAEPQRPRYRVSRTPLLPAEDALLARRGE